ncbi:MAG: UMP kinase [Christensenellaceae bacterium]|jgi:uridylate kinase|nr:UMP kinase [Christensenellaceae bacterium]
MNLTKYKRVLIKLSGEALAGSDGFGINRCVIDNIVSQIVELHRANVQICILAGGGNFWRGRIDPSMDRTTADHMGMLATVINCLALQDALERAGTQTRVQTAITIASVAEPYIRRKASNHLEEGRIVIFGCGTGNPYFTTDTAAVLKAAEMCVDVLLLAKNVDGIYSADPKKDKKARKFDQITYDELLKLNLKAMDQTAATLCIENNIRTLAFGLNEPNSIIRAITEEKFGTILQVKFD